MFRKLFKQTRQLNVHNTPPTLPTKESRESAYMNCVCANDLNAPMVLRSGSWRRHLSDFAAISAAFSLVFQIKTMVIFILPNGTHGKLFFLIFFLISKIY